MIWFVSAEALANPQPAQQIKDPALTQLWHRSQLWLRFNPWPRNFHVLHWCGQKRKKNPWQKGLYRWDEVKDYEMERLSWVHRVSPV